MSSSQPTGELATLEVVAEMVRGVTVRQLRAQVARGALPAAKVGKCLVVRIEDVRALYRPVAREPAPGRRRLSPTERADQQLREAGVGVPLGLSAAAGIDRR
jgi:hypothetical protein